MNTKHPANSSELKGKKGLRRLINAFGYSINGFKAAYKNEAAFREEVLLAVVLIPTAILLPVEAMEKLLMVVSVLLVLLVEILNSAIEAVVDRFGGEIHELSGRAKDLGSAAVLIALMIAGLIWGCILIPLLFAVPS